jgi:hypothetical protein
VVGAYRSPNSNRNILNHEEREEKLSPREFKQKYCANCEHINCPFCEHLAELFDILSKEKQ